MGVEISGRFGRHGLTLQISVPGQSSSPATPIDLAGA
jgi:hypothetical protein